jgi:hypothetical protein
MKAMAIVLAATVAACQATTSSRPPQIQAISAESGAFAPYRTFGFRLAGTPPSPYEVSARTFVVERRVRDLVATALARKGYREADAMPDFLIRLSSGTAKADSALTAAGAAYGTQGESLTSGEIVIDVFDGSTSQQVWRGTAQAEIDPQRIDELRLRSAVEQLLMRLPARGDAYAQR